MKMKKTGILAMALVLIAGLNTVKANDDGESVGWFEAEGKKVEVKFVRVLYAAEGSERPGESNSVEQLVFDSKDPQGNAVKVYRYQITAKNTGYDEVQQDKEADFKMKSVTEGVKLHVEVPLDPNGNPQFDKAYVGNLAYNFGTRETRHNLSAETVSNLNFKINNIDLPTFGAAHKPGDNGVIYNQGFIDFTLSSKAKRLDSDQFVDFNIHISAPITLTHVRGKERQDNAVSIDAGVVAQNIR
ncbi:MAG TPA: hypothetical protein VKZ78_05640 [Sphingobacteriaceae bacterium]|nr:hypothetical protein [Sphingobacteriaceae bacterium]